MASRCVTVFLIRRYRRGIEGAALGLAASHDGHASGGSFSRAAPWDAGFRTGESDRVASGEGI